MHLTIDRLLRILRIIVIYNTIDGLHNRIFRIFTISSKGNLKFVKYMNIVHAKTAS